MRGQVRRKQVSEAGCHHDGRKAGIQVGGGAVDAAVAVLCIGQDEDVRGAAAVVVVMLVVGFVTVVVDGFAGNVAEKPDEVPASVFMAEVDADAHISQDVSQGDGEAEDVSGGAFHLVQK
jgi:hypothetical protein